MLGPGVLWQDRGEENGSREDLSGHCPQSGAARSNGARKDCNVNRAAFPPVPTGSVPPPFADGTAMIVGSRETPSNQFYCRCADGPRHIDFPETRWTSAQRRNPKPPLSLPL